MPNWFAPPEWKNRASGDGFIRCKFRQLIDEQKYRKYQWIEADLEKSTNDTRPESYKIHGANINTLGQPLTTVNKWLERREAF